MKIAFPPPILTIAFLVRPALFRLSCPAPSRLEQTKRPCQKNTVETEGRLRPAPREQNATRSRAGGPPLPHIQILMAVYNGASYLGEQLASIATQDHSDWSLLASDDASTDGSYEVLQGFAAQHDPDRIKMISGPQAGAAANFMHLLQHSDPQADYLAFCDQDDVWLPHKLERAVSHLADHPADDPALYCSPTLVCDASLSNQQLSRPPQRALTFRNALVQNVVAGNTIVVNAAAARFLRNATLDVRSVTMHDWWIYQMITGLGGRIVRDDTPGLLYRQHGGNEIGAHHGLQAGMSRVTQVLQGRFRRWNDMNMTALSAVADQFTPDNQQALSTFASGRQSPLLSRLTALRASGVYRQSLLGDAALWVSAILNRV